MFKDIAVRPLFRSEHRVLREVVDAFVTENILPYHDDWEKEGQVTRDLWRKAGEAGLLCCTVPEEYGGPGSDFLYSAIVIEALARAGASGPGFWVHSEMAVPYISNFGTEDQKRRWLPRLVSGELISGIAMTEPCAGSDLRGIQTFARRVEGGYRINGQKVFISNGQLGDLFVVAAKTEKTSNPNSLSIFLVEAKSEGFQRGRNLVKIGHKAQDTSELFFEDIFVPRENLVGEEGAGFRQLKQGLVRERLSIAVSCQAKAEAAFWHTVEYVRDRKLFGRVLKDFQNTRFRLAEVKTELTVGRSFVDQMITLYLQGQLDANSAAIAKLWTSEMLGRTVDTCLQLHGGWGYMWEYPIARFYADARVERIVGGTSEVMKEIIGRTVTGE